MVAEVDDSCELRVVHASHVEQGVTAGVARQHSPEKRRAGAEDDAVGGNLLPVLCRQSYVVEIIVLSQLPEPLAHICFKVIPFQAELFR